MGQFGIHADPNPSLKGKYPSIKDDPTKTTNARGTLTYAMSGILILKLSYFLS